MQDTVIVGGVMKKIVNAPIQLLQYLKLQFPESSNNKLRKMLTNGRVTINSQTTHRAKHELLPGDIFELSNQELVKTSNRIQQKTLTNHDIEIIYEDTHIIVVNKPTKLLSVATDRLEKYTLHSKCVDYLQYNNKTSWCYIVHRLDKETSGIMVMAKDKSSKDYLQQQFARREIHRGYYAIVEGRPPQDFGLITQHLFEDKNLNVKSVNAKHQAGKQAITHWELVRSYGATSVLSIMIETGRRHQIRMAMKEIGCPIVGDLTHGAETDPFGRICLHATSLEFLHPISDEPIRFESKPPFARM